MTIIGLLILIILAAIVLAHVQMDSKLKNLAILVIAVLVLVWLLEFFGVFTIGFGHRPFR